MVSGNQLTVSFGGTDLFNNITFIVNPRDRIGLVGKNGAGKSTLLKIFAGLQEATSGTVVIPQDIDVGYLPQQMIHQSGRTVMEETRTAFDRVLGMLHEIERIHTEIAERTDYESDAYLDLLHRLTDLNEHYEMLGGATVDADVEKTLTGLGFSPSEFNRPTSELSGGWRMRIELAKILLRRPNVLLLDEPTNHLDMISKDVLKNALLQYRGSMIIVSHDRDFLDGLCEKIVEFKDKKIKTYLGDVFYFLEKKKLESFHELQRKTVSKEGNKATSNKEIYEKKKESEVAIRKITNQLNRIENEMKELTVKQQEIEKKLSLPEQYTLEINNGTLYQEYEHVKRMIEEKEEAWLLLNLSV